MPSEIEKCAKAVVEAITQNLCLYFYPSDRLIATTLILSHMAPAIEAAYREGWQVRNNYGRVEAQDANQDDEDFDWDNSKAHAALQGKESTP